MKVLCNEEICHFYRVGLTSATEELILRSSQFLIRKLAYKYGKYDNYFDLLQVAQMALIQAIRTFDYKKCPNFYAWGFRLIRRALARAAWQHKQYMMATHLVPDSRTLVSETVEVSAFSSLERWSEQKMLEKALEKLPDEHKYIIKKSFGIGNMRASFRQIGEELGTSHERVRRLKNDTLQNLRHMLTSEGNGG